MTLKRRNEYKFMEGMNMDQQRLLPTSFGIFGTCDRVDIFEFNSNDKIISRLPMRGKYFNGRHIKNKRGY